MTDGIKRCWWRGACTARCVDGVCDCDCVLYSVTRQASARCEQYGKPAHEGGSPSRGGPSPSWGGPGPPLKRFFFHFASRFTEERTIIAKSDNDVYEGTCVLSMHQFIEISICALENKINSNISMSSDPWKSVRQRVFPCTAAETIGRTKLPSSVWEENKFRGFPYETPTMPVVYRRSSQCLDGKKT